MTIDVSGFGLKVVLTASETFPSGITLSAFADDADALDTPAIQLRDKASGLNGDLVVWSKANPLVVTINVLPNSEDDNNLSILAATNRASAGRAPVLDEISITATYPDGTQDRYVRGVITDGIIGRPVSSGGRIKTKAYTFAFEDKVS